MASKITKHAEDLVKEALSQIPENLLYDTITPYKEIRKTKHINKRVYTLFIDYNFTNVQETVTFASIYSINDNTGRKYLDGYIDSDGPGYNIFRQHSKDRNFNLRIYKDYLSVKHLFDFVKSLNVKVNGQLNLQVISNRMILQHLIMGNGIKNQELSTKYRLVVDYTGPFLDNYYKDNFPVESDNGIHNTTFKKLYEEFFDYLVSNDVFIKHQEMSPTIY